MSLEQRSGTKAEQLILSFDAAPDYDPSRFVVAPPNSDAVRAIEQWPHWQTGIIAIYGPEGAGKSHLARIWAGRSGAQFVEAASLSEGNLPQLSERSALAMEHDGGIKDEAAYFYLLNLARQENVSVLLVGRQAPARWSVAMDALRSRLSTVPAFQMGPPSDEMLKALLEKLFADRQIELGHGVADYVVLRMERSFQGARRVVDALDRASLSRQRPITKRLAGDVLAELKEIRAEA